MLLKYCTQFISKLGKLSRGHRTGKGQFSFQSQGNAKECSNYRTIALISHASKVMLKIFQARFQQYVNCELPGIQARFRKGRGTRDQIADINKWPHELYPTRLFCPWDSPGKNTGVGAMFSSRGSSWPRDRTCVSLVCCTGRWFPNR